MRNETSLRLSGRLNPSANRAASQASAVKTEAHAHRVPATKEYLHALREADQAVFQAILRAMVARTKPSLAR